jgi:pimeloyl-ACP methyl ester carboxylesterase
VYLVEWPHVSMRMPPLVHQVGTPPCSQRARAPGPTYWAGCLNVQHKIVQHCTGQHTTHAPLSLQPPPSIEATVNSLAAILRADGHGERGACFVGHSLGTTAVAWLLHDQAAAPLVKSTVLLDPVTFILFDPAIAFNFIHRKPANSMQLLIHYFVSREMFIAHTLCRHFSWSHNVIFREDLADTPTTVVLSEHDEIVPFRKTLEYLVRENDRHGKKMAEVLVVSAHHGEMMLRAEHMRLVHQAIDFRCK